MNKQILTLAATSLFTASLASAEWTIANTFDDNSALAAVTDVERIEGSNARSEIVNGQLAVFPGNVFETNNNLFTYINLGTDIRADALTGDGIVTVYLEVTQPMVDDGAGGMRKAIVDTVWGISNIQPDDADNNTSYNNFNAMQRINVGNDNFEGRNGGSYEAIEPFQADVTYKIWLVIDYFFNSYQAYVEGGQWTTQTQIPSSSGNDWGFRVNPDDTNMVNHFLIALSRGNTVDGEKGVDPTYFDNIAYDTTGLNLTTPAVGATGPGALSAFPAVGDDVNTGSWMGWVYAANYPNVYIYSLDSWAFINEGTASSSGAWFYIFR